MFLFHTSVTLSSIFPCTVLVNVHSEILIIYINYLNIPARLATLPYGLDPNVTQLLANMLTKPSVFYCLPIVPCNLVSIKSLLLLQ